MNDTELRQQFQKIDKRFERADGKIEQILPLIGQFDRVVQKLVELDEKVSTLLPLRVEFHEFKDQVITTLDQHTGMLERLDQERLSQHARSDRIEVRVERLEKHTGLV